MDGRFRENPFLHWTKFLKRYLYVQVLLVVRIFIFTKIVTVHSKLYNLSELSQETLSA